MRNYTVEHRDGWWCVLLNEHNTFTVVGRYATREEADQHAQYVRNAMTPPLPPPPSPVARPPSHPQVAIRRTNGMAIASLCCSLGTLLVGISFILGIIFGHIALSQIRRDPSQQGRGLALAGVIVGYVFLGIFVLVIIAVAADPDSFD